MTAVGGHQAIYGIRDEWLTPPDLLRALGPFDVDPCATVGQCESKRPWPTAKLMYCEKDNGLFHSWGNRNMRVWLNPPYNRDVIHQWFNHLVLHGNGIALVFARTETHWFQDCVWKHADAVLFMRHRLHFWNADGTRSSKNAGAPSVLVAYGKQNVDALKRLGVPGAFVSSWKCTE